MRWLRYCTCLLVATLILCFGATPAFSQQDVESPEPHLRIGNYPPSPMGAGLQLGVPSGFSFKNYTSQHVAVTGSLVWDLETFAFASVNVVYEHPVPETPLNVFIGPGVMAGPGGFKDTHDYTIGLKGVMGVNMFLGQFEPFVALTPIVTLNVATQGYIGSIFGMRLYM